MKINDMELLIDAILEQFEKFVQQKELPEYIIKNQQNLILLFNLYLKKRGNEEFSA